MVARNVVRPGSSSFVLFIQDSSAICPLSSRVLNTRPSRRRHRALFFCPKSTIFAPIVFYFSGLADSVQVCTRTDRARTYVQRLLFAAHCVINCSYRRNSSLACTHHPSPCPTPHGPMSSRTHCSANLISPSLEYTNSTASPNTRLACKN